MWTVSTYQCVIMKNQRKNRRKRSRQSNRKNFGRARRNNMNQNMSLAIERRIQADTTLVHMRFSFTDGVQFTGAGEYAFSGNSIYDPGVAVSANLNPSGWTQWSNFYFKYRVLASRIKITFLALNASVPMELSLFPTNFISGVANLRDAQNQPYAKWTGLGVSTGMGKATLTSFMSTAKIYGQNIMTDDRFAAVFTAPPANEWFWVINSYDDIATANLQYKYDVCIDYKVLLFDRIPLNQSEPNPISVRQHIPIGQKFRAVVSDDEKGELI